MCKTLAELSGEYFDGVRIQDELIAKYREKLWKARQRHACEEEIKTARLLKMLYEQRNELIDTAYHLKNYYSCEDTQPVQTMCG